MAYKFVTKEEIDEAYLSVDCDIQLALLAADLLAERDAYRQIASTASCHSDFDCCAMDHTIVADRKAARLLEEKK